MIKAKPFLATAFVLVGLVATAGAAQAAPELIQNGSFETLTNGNGQVVPGKTSGSNITSANGWYSYSTTENSGYPFLFFTDNAVSTGFNDAWDNNGTKYLWGASNGGANTWNGTSAAGGNYLVMDGDYHATAISQNISNLVVGQSYNLSFLWAAAQWYGNTGATTEKLAITFDNKTVNTSTFSLPSTGFSGWMSTTMNFTYTGASNVLSFLAVGTPSGQPPMTLLDNVSLSAAVPEPGSLALVGTGLIGLGLLVRRRSAAKASGTAA